MNNLPDEAEKRKYELKRVIAQERKRLKRAPDGKLRISGGKFYHVTNDSSADGKYISVSKMRLIRALAQKDYDLEVLELAQNELTRLESGRFYYGKTYEEIFDSLHEKRKDLIVPAMLPDEMYIEKWLARPYEKMSFDDNAPGYFTESGVRVRSKSELIIANRFEKYHVPFLYEVPVYIGGSTFRPDFLVLKLPERKEIYWEHLGMLGNGDYCDKNIWKINTYSGGGIVIGDNLIITLESGQIPLNTDNIDQIIKRVILP